MPDDRLRKTVELMHGGKATFVQFVPVRETFEGKTVWEGVVHVFDLAGHRTATLVIANRGQHEAKVLRAAASAGPSIAHRLRCEPRSSRQSPRLQSLGASS
jgi:hypothetical protein